MNQLKIKPELFEILKDLRSAMLDDEGREVLNPLPTVTNTDIRPPSLQEQIQRLVRTELSRQVQQQGAETFEEANDFDVPDDDIPADTSPYTLLEEEEPIPPPPSPTKTTPAEPSTETATPPVDPAEPGE